MGIDNPSITVEGVMLLQRFTIFGMVIVQCKDININAHRPFSLTLNKRGVSIAELSEIKVVTLVLPIDNFVVGASKRRLQGKETLVVGPRHIHVDIVVPGNEPLMTRHADGGAIGAVPREMVLFAKGDESPEQGAKRSFKPLTFFLRSHLFYIYTIIP